MLLYPTILDVKRRGADRLATEKFSEPTAFVDIRMLNEKFVFDYCISDNFFKVFLLFYCKSLRPELIFCLRTKSLFGIFICVINYLLFLSQPNFQVSDFPRVVNVTKKFYFCAINYVPVVSIYSVLRLFVRVHIYS